MKKQLSVVVCGAVLVLGAMVVPVFGQGPDKAELEQVIAAAAQTQSGQSYEPFRKLEDWVRHAAAEPAKRAELEAGLVKLLGPEATVEARGFACKQLGIIGSADSLPALARLLPSPETAGFACLALTTYPHGPADEVLRGGLATAKGAARVQIINTLGDRHDRLSVGLLENDAWGADPAVAAAAVAAVGKIGGPDAQMALAALRQRGPRALKPVVLDASLRCAGQLAAQGQQGAAISLYEQLVARGLPADVRRSAFAALLRLEPGQAEHRIVEAIRHADMAVEPTAIAGIASLPGDAPIEPFLRLMPWLAPEEQALMLQSFARRGDYATVEAICKEVDAREPLVRQAALSSLGQAGDIGAVPVLVRALVELQSPEDLRAAGGALAELGGGSATDDAILHALNTSAGRLRVRLVSVVSRREGERANALLLDEAGNDDPAVAAAALRCLGRTARPSDVPALLTRLVEAHHPDVSAEAESAAVQATSRIEDVTRRSAVVREALDRAQTVSGRCALLGLLPECGDAPALEAVRAAAVSTEPPVHEAGVRALADWPDLSAWDALAGAFRQSKTQPTRGMALHGLVRLAGEANAHPDGTLMKRYRALFEDAKSDDEVKAILGALGGAAYPEALDLAQSYVDRPGVKAEADAAVKRISTALKAKGPQAEEEAPKEQKAPEKQ